MPEQTTPSNPSDNKEKFYRVQFKVKWDESQPFRNNTSSIIIENENFHK